MKVKVDEKACISCGICANVCPEAFEIVDSNKGAKFRAGCDVVKNRECLISAKELCPVQAIHIDEE